MMVASTTDTCWSLSMCNKIHFTKVHSLICYILHLTFFLADFFCLLVGSSWEIIHLTLKKVTPVKTASLMIKPMSSEREIDCVSTIFPTDVTLRKSTYKAHKRNLTITVGLYTHSTKKIIFACYVPHPTTCRLGVCALHVRLVLSIWLGEDIFPVSVAGFTDHLVPKIQSRTGSETWFARDRSDCWLDSPIWRRLAESSV